MRYETNTNNRWRIQERRLNKQDIIPAYYYLFLDRRALLCGRRVVDIALLSIDNTLRQANILDRVAKKLPFLNEADRKKRKAFYEERILKS